jgi:hypothetical protein
VLTCPLKRGKFCFDEPLPPTEEDTFSRRSCCPSVRLSPDHPPHIGSIPPTGVRMVFACYRPSLGRAGPAPKAAFGR